MTFPRSLPPLEERPAPGPGLLTDLGRLLDRLWRLAADAVIPPRSLRGIGR